MILVFHRLQAGRRGRGGAFVPTWVFVAGYMLVWTLAGAAAYAAALAGEAVAASVALSPETGARVGGVVLVAAGIYQISPLKDLCLSKCRTPVGFIMTSWREGTLGALRMGLLHGAYCLGCCWLLFAMLFPLGMMNIAAMAVVTVLVFAEKTLPWGPRAAQATAAALIAYGALAVGIPQILPTFPVGSDTAAPAGVGMPMQMDMSGHGGAAPSSPP
jgi:predicted metal-binding membrane protein